MRADNVFKVAVPFDLMPIIRLVEFRVALPASVAPTAIFYIGRTGKAMFEERPHLLPSPAEPGLFAKLRDVSSLAAKIAGYVGTRQKTELEFMPLERHVEEAESTLRDAVSRIEAFLAGLEEVRDRLAYLEKLDKVRSIVGHVPSTAFLNADLVLVQRGKEQDLMKGAELMGVVYSPVGSVDDSAVGVLIYTKDKERDARDFLTRMGASLVEFSELEKTADIPMLKSKLEEYEAAIRRTVESFGARLHRALTVVDAASKVRDVYSRSALSEGREMEDYVSSIKDEIGRLYQRLEHMDKLLRFLEVMHSEGTRSLGASRIYALVLEPQNVDKLHVQGELAGIRYAIILEPIDRPERYGLPVPLEYLRDIASSIQGIRRLREETLRSIRDKERLLEKIMEVYRESSVFGDHEWDKRPDVVSITFYVKEEDTSTVDEALSWLVRDTGTDISVVRRMKVKYVKEVDPHKMPTLEKYVQPVESFKNIVYMYGVPRPIEVSPVPLAAVIFPFFFGFMYGDAGHGTLLTILGILLIWKLWNGKHRNWGIVWLVTGLTAVFFGTVVYGEVFGFSVLSPIIHLYGAEGLEEKGTLLVLKLSFAVGFVVLLLSFLLKVVNLVREGETDIALLIAVPILLIYLSAAMVFMGVIPSFEVFKIASASLPWMYVALASIAYLIIGGVVLKLRYRSVEGAPSVGEEVIMGIIESLIAAIANIISFGRLAIMIIIHVVFTKMVASTIVLGPVAILIIIFGNLLIAVGEGFITAVQALRLVYYETLTKFYSGNGRLFAPLSI